MTLRVAAQPIGWSNDDFRDLGGDIPLERCLREMSEAGYEGTELGHKFPRDPRKLKPLLDSFGLALASGWHSSYLLSNRLAREESVWLAHVEILKALGCRVAIIAECTGAVYSGNPRAALRTPGQANGLSEERWETLLSGLDRLAELAEAEGLELAYHPHMGTVVQSEAEVERLLASTRRVRLVLDTGHLAFAGADPAALAKRWAGHVAHAHLKNVRPAVLAAARAGAYSFERAVREGVFTVPGDGGLDFAPVLRALEDAGYRGWLVVEAEQDPVRAAPLEYAKRARAYLKGLGN